jgi:hypothetical protein
MEAAIMYWIDHCVVATKKWRAEVCDGGVRETCQKSAVIRRPQWHAFGEVDDGKCNIQCKYSAEPFHRL